MTLMGTRKNLDVGRLREAIGGPGIDPSSWLSLARVDDDPDAITFDPQLGWLIDVTLHGGKLDQEGPVTCRVSSAFAGNRQLQSSPIDLGCEVQVLLNGSDPNDSPVIVGMVPNEGGCVVPTTVNGTPITETLMRETHVLVTPYGMQFQVGGEWRMDATEKAGLHAPEVTLASNTASQSYVRGENYADALDTFLNGLTVYINALGAGSGAPPNAALTVAQALAAAQVLQPLIQNFQAARTAYLSLRIKGE